jgi:hypothetical protein
MSLELDILRDVCGRLEKAGIPYMLTGSFATHAYVTPRMTRDIDLVVELKEEDAAGFSRLFGEDYYCDADLVTEAVRGKGMFNLIHQKAVVKVDFVVRKNSTYRELEFKRRRRADIAGVSVWVVSPEDLILSKLDWAKDSLSDMQLKDVSLLLKGVKSLDHTYLNEWIGKLGLEKVREKVPA